VTETFPFKGKETVLKECSTAATNSILLLLSNKIKKKKKKKKKIRTVTVVSLCFVVGVSKALKSHGISNSGSHVIELEN